METPSPAALIISGAFPLCPIDNQLRSWKMLPGWVREQGQIYPGLFLHRFIVASRGSSQVLGAPWGEDPRLTRTRVGSEVSKPSRDGVLRLAAVQADGFVPANHQPSGRSPTRAKFRYSGSTPPPKGVLPGVAIVLNS